MDLKSLITILELATTCKLKSKAILSDGHLLSDYVLEVNCHYFIALLDTIYTVERMISEFAEKGKNIEEVASLANLYENILRCSEIEVRLSEEINITTH